MTWITNAAPAPVDAPTPEAHDQPGTELAPGVLVERRTILWLPAVTAAALLLGRCRRLLAAETDKAGAAPSPEPGQLDWDEFLRQCLPAAKGMVADVSPDGQDAYLHRVASYAVRLKAAPHTKLFPFGKLQPKVEFAPSFRGVPFFIIQWRMEPHAVLPAHCHPQASVCTLGLEGEALVRHFEVHGDAPAFDSGSDRPFEIRETRSQLIAPHRISTLSAARDNMHYFEAGDQGARGIDITTMYGGKGHFSFVAFEPTKPKDAERRIYEAAWIGEKPR